MPCHESKRLSNQEALFISKFYAFFYYSFNFLTGMLILRICVALAYHFLKLLINTSSALLNNKSQERNIPKTKNIQQCSLKS